MNFKGHFVGGVVVSAMISTTSSVMITEPLMIASPAILFVFCLFMSLFPDLDTASIPQRWFYRLMFVLLPFLLYKGEQDLFNIAAIISISPLLHKHRGWTHWKITPWVIGVFTLYLYDISSNHTSINNSFLLKNVVFFFSSVVLGHYTHLLLDSKSIKIFSNSKDHY